MASATQAALPHGQANVTDNLKAKDLLPAAFIASAREVRGTLLSTVNDLVMHKAKPLTKDLADALAPLQVQIPRDRRLAKEAIRIAAGLVAGAGNCDEFARIAATTDVGNLVTHLAGGKTPFPHTWAVVENETGHRMNVDTWSKGAPAVAPRHARHSIGQGDGKSTLTLNQSERDKVRVAAGKVAKLISKTPELQSQMQESQAAAMEKLQAVDDLTAALGGFHTAPSAFSDSYLSKAQDSMPIEAPILAELHAAQWVRSQGLGLSASRRGEMTSQIVAERFAQAGLPPGTLANATPDPKVRQAIGRVKVEVA